MSKRIATQIAEHFGWDIDDIRDYEYHPGAWTRKVYAGMDGNNYWSAGGKTPPRYIGHDHAPLVWVRVKSNWPGNPDLWCGTDERVA